MAFNLEAIQALSEARAHQQARGETYDNDPGGLESITGTRDGYDVESQHLLEDLTNHGWVLVRNPELSRDQRIADLLEAAEQRVRDAEAQVASLKAALKIFLGGDEWFQIAVGGNPIAIQTMYDQAINLL